MEKEFESIKKSLSIGNLNSSVSSSSLVAEQLHTDGYLSDGPVHHARRKGQAWTDIEHQLFLKGLEKLGRGDWKGIANKFVMTRSASQVASHAQKHFLRRTTSDHKKKRPSVFDTHLIKHPIHPLPPPPPSQLDGFGVDHGFVEPKKRAKEPQEQVNNPAPQQQLQRASADSHGMIIGTIKPRYSVKRKEIRSVEDGCKQSTEENMDASSQQRRRWMRKRLIKEEPVNGATQAAVQERNSSKKQRFSIWKSRIQIPRSQTWKRR